MMQIPHSTTPFCQSAAGARLAAAGPVEPSASPEPAPGPTLSRPTRTRADYFHSRKTPQLVNQARTLYRRGENYSSIARALGVTSDTARRWLHPDYDTQRRSRASTRSWPAGEDGEDMLPTLPFVPGLVISGRYRMRRSA